MRRLLAAHSRKRTRRWSVGASARQHAGRCGGRASRRLPAVLGLGRAVTHFAPIPADSRYAQTFGESVTSALRALARHCAPRRRRNRPANTYREGERRDVRPTAHRCHKRARQARCALGAEARRHMASARSAPRDLTRRDCLNAAPAGREVSLRARPWERAPRESAKPTVGHRSDRGLPGPALASIESDDFGNAPRPVSGSKTSTMNRCDSITAPAIHQMVQRQPRQQRLHVGRDHLTGAVGVGLRSHVRQHRHLRV